MEETVKLSPTISVSSHPLFSCFITLYSLILIYFPNDSLRILLSPVFLISATLVLALLRLGSTPESNTRPGDIHVNRLGETGSVNVEEAEESKVLVRDPSLEATRELDFDTKPNFMEWNLRAPLEVIHEAYEDDDDDDDDEENPSVSDVKDPTRLRVIEKYSSLALCYPGSDSESDSESDSGSSSDFDFPEIGNWISPGKMGFKWEEENDGTRCEGLIEIKLDEYCRSDNKIRSKWNQTERDFHAEEEGLIEIDIFP